MAAGLLSGTSLAVAGHAGGTQVWGAEPVLADDAARSLHTGVRQPPLPPTSLADGLLTSLSDRTFRIIGEHVTDIVTVTEDQIVDAMRFCWTRLKQLDRTERRGRCRRGAVRPGARGPDRRHRDRWQRRPRLAPVVRSAS